MKYVGSIIRHGLSALGGYLVAKGVIDAETAARFADVGFEVALGVASYVVAQFLSIKEKKER